MIKALKFRTPFSNGLFWGVTGGLLFLLLRFLPVKTAVAEIAMIIVYIASLILSFFTFRPDSSARNFFRSFLSCSLTFLLIPVFAHAGLIIIYRETNYISGIMVPALIYAGFGLVLCLGLTFLVTRLSARIK